MTAAELAAAMRADAESHRARAAELEQLARTLNPPRRGRPPRNATPTTPRPTIGA